uniref:hypothetical protein n=1 Tax=uncultured Cyclobacterium sp. TaxID=453820 RepID=UPI0030ED9FE3
MKNISLLSLLLTFLAFQPAFSQSSNYGEIQGKVIDEDGGSPLGFATISVFSLETEDKKLINGGITTEDGS